MTNQSRRFPRFPVPSSSMTDPHMTGPHMTDPHMTFPHMASSLSRSSAAVVVVAMLTACHRPDLTEAAVPAAATQLSLVSQLATDTAHVDLTLGGGKPTSLGSVTGEVAHLGDWQFVACEAQQPQALLACKPHGATVRVAAAWAGGTHAGALVRLTFVRAVPNAEPTWMLAVSEAHGAQGVRVLESVEVRKQSVPGSVR